MSTRSKPDDRPFPRCLPWLALLLLLSTALPAVAQDGAASEETDESVAQAEPAASTFTDSIDVRVVNLEVVVTDRDGERVPGLGPRDFRLEVDGEPMAIDYFTEVRDGRAVARGEAGGSGVPGGPAPAPTRAGHVVPSKVLLFIDGAFGAPKGFHPFQQAIVEQSAAFGPDEEMAIVFFDGRDLSILSDWTSSAEQVRRALGRLDTEAFEGQERFLEHRSYQRALGAERDYVAESSVRGDPVTPLADLPEFAVTKKRLERRVDRVARAVTAALHRFAGAEGRKIALLWSGGWPWSSFEMLRPPWSSDLSSARRSETSLQRVTDAANRLGFTLYMADTPVSSYDPATQRQHHDTLDFLADGTGGRAFKDRYALAALEQSRDDLRSYYWLGFTARGEGTGKRLKIDVDTTRRGLDVRSRTSWLDAEVDAVLEQEIEAMAFFSAFADSPHAEADGERQGRAFGAEPAALGLTFGEPVLERRRARVPVTVAIPLEAITMLPSAEGFTATLEVRISVIDDDGAMSEMPVLPLVFHGGEPRYGDLFYYQTELELRRKPHDVTVAVHDTVSGAVVTGRHRLELAR